MESVLDQTNGTARQAKLPGTDQMVVQERLHQKAAEGANAFVLN